MTKKKKLINNRGRKRIDRRKKIKNMHIIDENTTPREYELARNDLFEFLAKREY